MRQEHSHDRQRRAQSAAGCSTCWPGTDPAEIARGAELRAQPRPRLFRTVWRWHFYAGLLVIPTIVILSLSGIVYRSSHEQS